MLSLFLVEHNLQLSKFIVTDEKKKETTQISFGLICELSGTMLLSKYVKIIGAKLKKQLPNALWVDTIYLVFACNSYRIDSRVNQIIVGRFHSCLTIFHITYSQLEFTTFSDIRIRCCSCLWIISLTPYAYPFPCAQNDSCICMKSCVLIYLQFEETTRTFVYV